LRDEIVPAAGASRIDAVLTDREGAALVELLAAVAGRPGPIAGVFRYSAGARRRGDPAPLDFLVAERSICINTTAAGGNASLMTIG
jgi:RHH-type proline utilization regulon transcriptional repressor/proline dehydrogenase/delta 1-pyrroline-5-carboxylate dehydrogenase